MAAYVIIQMNISDAEKYEAYKKLTPASIEKYGGRFLVRGGTKKDLEGRLDFSRIVMLEFPDAARAEKWYGSPEYRAAKAVREGASDGIFTLVEGA